MDVLVVVVGLRAVGVPLVGFEDCWVREINAEDGAGD